MCIYLWNWAIKAIRRQWCVAEKPAGGAVGSPPVCVYVKVSRVLMKTRDWGSFAVKYKVISIVVGRPFIESWEEVRKLKRKCKPAAELASILTHTHTDAILHLKPTADEYCSFLNDH